MLTTEPTPKIISKPNRRTGNEVDQYFRKKYSYQIFNNAEFQEIAALNITKNEFFRSKLPKDELPNIQSYQTNNVLVAIDLSSGEFHIESKNAEEAAPIYDDLFVYRGLDEEDLKNFFLVAEYVRLTQN